MCEKFCQSSTLFSVQQSPKHAENETVSHFFKVGVGLYNGTDSSVHGLPDTRWTSESYTQMGEKVASGNGEPLKRRTTRRDQTRAINLCELRGKCEEEWEFCGKSRWALQRPFTERMAKSLLSPLISGLRWWVEKSKKTETENVNNVVSVVWKVSLKKDEINKMST